MLRANDSQCANNRDGFYGYCARGDIGSGDRTVVSDGGVAFAWRAKVLAPLATATSSAVRIICWRAVHDVQSHAYDGNG